MNLILKSLMILAVVFLGSCAKENHAPEFSMQLKQQNKNSIIGGADVTSVNPISRFTVGLYDKKTRFVCTGSLIKENLIVTAAHCIESSAANIVIIFGLDFSAYDKTDLKMLRYANAVKFHAGFKKDPSTDLDWDDIALVQFSGGIPEGFAPIEVLKDANLLQQGSILQMAGYGASKVELEEVASKKDKKFQRDLDAGDIVCYDKSLNHCFRITFFGTDRLRSTETKIEGFTEKEIRTNEARGHGTCVGDSGGPLIYQNEKELYLVGVTSRGSQFCDGPAIYTNTGKYIDWIEKAIDPITKNL